MHHAPTTPHAPHIAHPAANTYNRQIQPLTISDHGGRVMPKSIPTPLLSLLRARDEVAQNGAWSGFLDEYSDILLKTARRASFDHDGALDHYSYMREQLRQDGFRRLRAYQGDSRGKFATWLVVVARRLCVDHHRHTHGRLQTTAESPAWGSPQDGTRW